MQNWLKYINMATTALMIAEDGKIDESEEDVIADMIAPELAKLYGEQDNMVRLLVKIAHQTIDIIENQE